MIRAMGSFALTSFVAGALAHLTAVLLHESEFASADHYARAARVFIRIGFVSGTVALLLRAIASA